MQFWWNSFYSIQTYENILETPERKFPCPPPFRCSFSTFEEIAFKPTTTHQREKKREKNALVLVSILASPFWISKRNVSLILIYFFFGMQKEKKKKKSTKENNKISFPFLVHINGKRLCIGHDDNYRMIKKKNE